MGSMKWLSRWAWLRLLVVTALSAVLFGCGGNGTGGAPGTGSSGSNNNGGGGGGNPPVTSTTKLHLFTSLCDLPNGCPVNEVPYRVNVSIEFQRTNGWVVITGANGIDTGVMGEVLITLSEAGTYRIKALPVQPSTTTRNGTAPDAVVTLIDSQTTTHKIQFTPF